MVSPVEFTTKAARWVRLRRAEDGDDPPFTMDANGFLAEPDVQSGSWRRPEEAAENGGWVLLGEPGAGKTTAFTDLIPEAERDHPPLPGSSGTVWLTGDELESRAAVDDRLGGYLDALPPKSETGSEPPAVPLLVVIDQLDECLFLRHLSKWLTRRLRGRDCRGLRVWIACRTADYREEITDVLVNQLGSCTVGDLAPLTYQDAADLVAATEVDTDTFLSTVVNNGAGPLACLPLTLKVLLNAFKQAPGSLQEAPVQWLERGVTLLADEHAPDRVSDRTPESTTEQRVSVAARVAAHLLLSGRRSVHKAVLDDGVADRAIPIGQMVGDNEVAGSGEFEVTRSLVDETLATAIFTSTSPGKVAFAHSSFAAFLAARYLAARLTAPMPVPVKQLEGVLLGSAADEDTAAIPEHLRETVAWLLAHAPDEARWLALADPEGLAAHSAVITSPSIRADLVDGLLARAERIELADRSWQRTRWQLAHPDLGGQLSSVLDELIGDPGDEWRTFARARLAIRLASDSGLPALAEPLLRVAEGAQWPVVVRQSAAKAALAVDPSAAVVGRLRDLLQSLAPQVGTDPSTHREIDRGADSVSELVGTLLHLLWPAHLSFAEASRHIDPGAGIVGFIGVYYLEVSRFPASVADDDVHNLIAFAEKTLHDNGILVANLDPTAAYEEDDGEDEPDGLILPRKPGYLGHERVRRLRDFIADVAERVLKSPHAVELLDRTSRAVLWFLSSSERLPTPSAIDLVDADSGVEDLSTRELRRSFAEALLRAVQQEDAADRRYWTYAVITQWGRPPYGADRGAPDGTRRAGRRVLLDHADAEWAMTRSAHHRAAGATLLADSFADLAEGLAQPVASPAEQQTVQVWEDAEAFGELQRERLRAAVSGDSKAFMLLVKDLEVNLETGRYDLSTSWRRTGSPGAILWRAEELRAKLRVAALNYLSTEHDRYETWLGLGSTLRGDAGMVALATLHFDRESANPLQSEGGLDILPLESWKSWVGTILYGLGRSRESEASLDRELVSRVAAHAHDEMGAALVQYVRTAIVHRNQPLRMPELPHAFAPLMVELAEEVGAALRAPDVADGVDMGSERAVVTEGPITLTGDVVRSTAVVSWANLLQQPLEIDNPTAVDLANSAIATAIEGDDEKIISAMAAAAGYALLTADAEAHWSVIHDYVVSSPTFARDLAFACADDHMSIMDNLTDEQLGEMYRWLTSVCPPETDVLKQSFFVGREHQVHDWRRHLITALAQRGSAASVLVLRDLVDTYPDLLAIQAALHEARRRDQANGAAQLSPQQITMLLSDRSRRVVNSAAQLAGVVVEVLDEIQADLHTHGNVLWDCERVAREADAESGSRRKLMWRPKPEGTLAAYLAHELRQRLERRRVVVNREVVIRPTDEGDSGERPDIKLDVVSSAKHAPLGAQVTVPIEIKGAWHKAVLTAQSEQLEQRYLRDLNTTDGVYLVAWYPLTHWNMLTTEDPRKSAANGHGSAEELKDVLSQQAKDIFESTHRRTHPYVLTVVRAVSADDRILLPALPAPSGP